MYAEINFKTKKVFREAVKEGQKIRLFAPGLGRPNDNGRETVEGPWSPQSHTWYATVEVEDGIVVNVK